LCTQLNHCHALAALTLWFVQVESLEEDKYECHQCQCKGCIQDFGPDVTAFALAGIEPNLVPEYNAEANIMGLQLNQNRMLKFGIQRLYEPRQAIIQRARQRVQGWAVKSDSDVAKG